MHRARVSLTTVLAGLLLATGCTGCGDESTAETKAGGQKKPAAQPESDPAPAPSVPDPPKRPPDPPKQPIKPQLSEVEHAIKKLKELGATVDRTKRADGTYNPVRGVYLANNNRHARKAMKYVAQLPTIRKLYISGASITDVDMFYLHELVHLESLKLRDTNVSSQGLAYLQNMSNLEYLNLINTKVNDDGMKYLYGLKNLKKLYLGGTKVSRKGGDELRKQIPGLIIR